MIKKRIYTEIVSCFEKEKLICNLKLSVEIPKDSEHGDYSTNVAMISAKLNKMTPVELAERIKEALLKNKMFESIEIAGPGFINLTISKSIYHQELEKILQLKEDFGNSEHGQNQKVLIEFVSANPTGPLNIVSARAAAFGDSLYRIMKCVGYQPTREFYVNDAGNQVEILAESLELRFREFLGEKIGEFPMEAYHGEYLRDLAVLLNSIEGTRILHLPESDRIEKIKEFALEEIHQMQINSLEQFDVSFDSWISEKTLRGQGIVEEVLSFLTEANCTYEKEDAIWFSSSKFGDEKDRVLMKADGTYTYFVPDIAYHLTKYQRGFDIIIDVLGPDHHGYIPRLKAAIQALKYQEDKLEIIYLQQVNIFDEGEKVKMSKRLGKIVTMDELIECAGKDAARFFFLNRKPNAHLNFDLELAMRQTSENPVYYCQYAHARICSILAKAEKNKLYLESFDTAKLKKLDKPEEISIIRKLLSYPDLLVGAADNREPHRITDYIQDLAGMFHKYYQLYPIVNTKAKETSLARIYLISAIKQVLENALGVLGISAPDKM